MKLSDDYSIDTINFFSKYGKEFDISSLPLVNDVTEKNIAYQTGWPFIETHICAPYKDIYKEVKAIIHKFVEYEPRKASHYLGLDKPIFPKRSDSMGWRAINLKGINEHAVGHHSNYGFPEHMNINEIPSAWTNISKECPITTHWIKNLPYSKIYKARLMLLKAGHAIFPHSGKKNNDGIAELGPLNIAIHNPDDFYFLVKDFGYIPFSNGKCFWFAPGFEHALVNQSHEDRLHIIIEGEFNSDFMAQMVVRHKAMCDQVRESNRRR